MRSALVGAAALAAIAALGTLAYGQYSGPQQILGVTTSDEYSIAKRLMRRQEYQDAIPHLLSALADKPRDVEIINNLAYAKRMVGDYDTSLLYYKRALTINPDRKSTHEGMGEVYLQMHDLASAQKELDTIASLCPSGCDERDALTKAIAAYAPPAPAAASAPGSPSTPATPAPATPPSTSKP